jgi:ATP-dependent Clp protease ATP-binding subunit ClpA
MLERVHAGFRSPGPLEGTPKMQERFSDRARHAMALANQEAARLNHNYLAPEHILLGLIAEGACVATEALRLLDVDVNKIRHKVASQMKKGEGNGSVGRRPQTNETKEVISRAIAEARNSQHRYIGTEHLVLALLQVPHALPAQVLHEEGVDPGRLRGKVEAMLRSNLDKDHDLAHSRHGDFEWVHQQELAKAFRSPKFWHTMILAVDSANRLGAGEVEPQHLLLALLRDESTGVARLLRDKGVTTDWLNDQLTHR